MLSRGERMKLLLSSVMLIDLLILSCWGVSSGFVVTQTPDVSVMEWKTANISCCWTETFERVSVNWLKNQTEVTSDSIISNTKCQGSLPHEPCKCSTLTFTNITREDSGRYICRVTVDIPVYTVAEGNGTVITVTATENTGDDIDAVRGRRLIPVLTRDQTKRPETNRDDVTYENTAVRGRRIIPVLTRDETKRPETNTDDVTYENTAGVSDAPQEDVLVHIVRCLPVLALIITFFYLYTSSSKAQPHTPDAPENKFTSSQRTEEDQEEEEKTERETENEKGEENNAKSED